MTLARKLSKRSKECDTIRRKIHFCIYLFCDIIEFSIRMKFARAKPVRRIVYDYNQADFPYTS